MNPPPSPWFSSSAGNGHRGPPRQIYNFSAVVLGHREEWPRELPDRRSGRGWHAGSGLGQEQLKVEDAAFGEAGLAVGEIQRPQAPEPLVVPQAIQFAR